MEHKHTPGEWIKASALMPVEYEEVYAKHRDGSVRIARLSKSEGGCWQLATFLVGTKRPGYAWPVDQVVEWRPIQPATTVAIAAPELLEALLIAESFMAGFEDDESQEGIQDNLRQIRAALAKATGT